jgi:hypothetical protein
MRKQLRIWLLAIGCGLWVLALNFGWTEDKTKPTDQPAKSSKSAEEKEKPPSMDDDLDDLNKQLKPDREELEEVDVLATLNKIIEKMADAEDFLSQASLWKALTPHG